MIDRMQRLRRAVSRQWQQTFPQRQARAARAANLRMMVEGLEERIVLATDTWLPGGGGIWELASNWSLGAVPTAADDAVIALGAAGTIQLTKAGDVAKSITTNSNSALQVDIGGTFALGAGASTIDAALTIVPGASMTVASSAPLAINDAFIGVEGTLTLSSGDVVTMTGSQMFPGVFEVTGVMTATADKFTGGSYTGIDVDQGAEFFATSNTFTLPGVFFAQGSILNPTDVTNNDFTGTVLELPATYIPSITNNKAFGEVDVDSFSLASGTNLTLPDMGTVSQTALYYRFVEGFQVNAGATLNVDPGVSIAFSVLTPNGVIGTTLSVNANGFVNLTQGDKVGLYTMPNSTTTPTGSIFDSGTIIANQTSFYNLNYGSGSAFTQLVVNPGGHLISTNGSFSVGQVYLDDNSILNSGDLTGNDFSGTVLSLKAANVPLVTNNLQFTEVDLHGGTLPSPITLPLTAMGTKSNLNLFYVFVGNYTVSKGATLTFAPGLRVQNYSPVTVNKVVVQEGWTLTDNGTVTFGQGDLFTLNTAIDKTVTPNVILQAGQLIVNGVLTATGTNFLNLPGSAATTQISINTGAHVSGTNDDFATTFTALANGSILNADTTSTTNVATALTNNDFANTDLSLPATDIPLVTNNQQFTEVDILPGTLSTNLELTAMGTVLTSTLFYVFAGDFTIAKGATLNVDSRLLVYNEGQLTDSGTLNFNVGDSVVLLGFGAPPAGQITVNGVLNALGTKFTGNGAGIVANSGASLTATSGQFLGANVTLNPGVTASLTNSTLTAPLSIDSTDTINITGNNLAQIGFQGVIATGSPTATINLPGNYWGTANTAQIEALILDKLDTPVTTPPTAPTRPLVTFTPFYLNASVVAAANTTATYSSATQNVTLKASVIGATGTITGGTVTFQIFNNNALVGTAQTATESNGQASVTYALPAGLAVGSYSIAATYSDVAGSTNALPGVDTSHLLTVLQAMTTTVAPAGGVSVPYNSLAPEVATVSASVTSIGGTINEGTITFTVFNVSGTAPIQIGTPVQVPVVNGVASGPFSLPAGTPGGTYSVTAGFTGSQNYSSSGPITFNLTVTPAATTTTATASTTTFSTLAQTFDVSAAVASAAGAVNEGSVTFTLLSGTTVVGTPVVVTVANGVASGIYSLPAGTAVGSYIIQAVYGGTGDYSTSTSTASTLTITKAGTRSTSTSVTASYDTGTQQVTLSANILSGAVQVNEGTVSFEILNGSTVLGTVTTANVAKGVATAIYALPGGLTLGGTYTILANFNGSGDYLPSTDSTGKLTIVQATPTVVVATAPGVYDPTSESFTAQTAVTNFGTPVNDGTVTFQAYVGNTAVGSAVTVGLINGVATAALTLPGGTKVGTTATVIATYSGTVNYATGVSVAAVTLNQATPKVGWVVPGNLVFGQALTTAQLDAAASVPGTFVYAPAVGTVLGAGGGQTLTATFTPTDTVDYTKATASATINVLQAVPTFINLSAPGLVQFGQPTITIAGRLAAPTAIPVGQSVLIVIDSGTNAVQTTATVGADGTFSATVGVGALGVGRYAVRFGYAGDANFTAAFDGSTALTVTQATQALTVFDPPASAIFGVTFHVDLASTSGLPVTLTATNAFVQPSATGGYDVTLTSGSANAVLTATQAGDADQLPLSVSQTVTAVKAQAILVLSGTQGVFYDGSAHPVGYATNPAGLAAAVTYTLNGAAVAAPVQPGLYNVTATVEDANYQGTASSQLAIVAPVVTTPVTPINPVVGPVSLLSIVTASNKHKQLTTITLTFSGALDGNSAVNLGNYRLATAGKGGSFDAKNARTYKIKGATYNATTNSVTLTLAKPFALSQAVQVRVYGGASRGLTDSLGRLIDGKHAGSFGGDENATITKKRASV